MYDIVARLEAQLKLKKLGPIKQFLGLRITRDRKTGTFSVDQSVYASNVLKAFGFHGPCRAEHLPIPVNVDKIVVPSLRQGAKDSVGTINASNYAAFIGSMMFLSSNTRPDIAFAVGYLSRFTAHPEPVHFSLGKHLLRYLSGSLNQRLTYSSHGSSELVVYSDSDWARDHTRDALSVTGVVALLAGAAISWQSKKQKTVSLSSSEAEYKAASDAAREISFLRTCLASLGLPQERGTTLFMDNQTAIRFAIDDGGGNNRKHINVIHHYIREKIKEDWIVPQWIPTAEELADILTKPLPRPAFERLREAIMGKPAFS
jgi:hypothetical protein